MRTEMIFDGVRSGSYEVYVADYTRFAAPKRLVEDIIIPGMNGTLTIDKGSYEDRILTVRCYAADNGPESVRELREILYADAGYRRLSFTDNTEEFFLAKYREAFDVGDNSRDKAEFEVVFTCRPQRFLTAGEEPQTVTEDGLLLTNPSAQEAKPLIRVYGTGGVLSVGDRMLYLDTIDEYVDLDCELQEAYKGSNNCNGNVRIAAWPILKNGQTGITFGGNITEAEVTPRWWRV